MKWLITADPESEINDQASKEAERWASAHEGAVQLRRQVMGLRDGGNAMAGHYVSPIPFVPWLTALRRRASFMYVEAMKAEPTPRRCSPIPMPIPA